MKEKNPQTNETHVESVEKLTAVEFRELLRVHGIDGDTPQERAEQLKQFTTRQMAELWSDANRGLLGRTDDTINPRMTRIGERETIPVENRYEVLDDFTAAIREVPNTLAPERVGDAVALGIVLLHPFVDGNGRTARTLAMVFRDSYDGDSYDATYRAISQSRDELRALRKEGRGGFMPNGYIPRMTGDQSNPEQVKTYLRAVLDDAQPRPQYVSTF